MKDSQQVNEPTETEIDTAVAAIAADVNEPARSTASQEDDLFAELAQLNVELSGRPFGCAEDLFEAEHAEQLGVWQRWPAAEDAEILIAHLSSTIEKRDNLEKRFREKWNIPVGTALTRKANEALFRESMFGTAVKAWRGKFFAEWEFNQINFRKFMASRLFRSFVLSKSTVTEEFRAKRAEDLRGN